MVAATSNQRSMADYEAEIAELRQERDDAKSALATKSALHYGIGKKGGLCIYGLTSGRFPTTFYLSQLQRLVDALPEIKVYVNAHKAEFSTGKDDPRFKDVADTDQRVVPITRGLDASSLL